jgi:hypothetical protein
MPSLKSEVSDAIAVAMFTRNDMLFGSWKPPSGGLPGGAGAGFGQGFAETARAGNRRFGQLSALRAHAKAP